MYIAARLIHTIFGIYIFGLFIYSILSWMRSPETDKISAWLTRFYEPLLRPIRQRVKPIMLAGNYVDLSVIILLVALYFLRSMIISLLIPNF